MNPERWEAVKKLFNAALELPVEQREAFLASAPGADSSIRAEVEMLLKADDDAGSYLERPLLESQVEPPAYLVSPGDTLCGRFKIVRAIGEGGMGHVFEAHDSELAVNVALKVLRSEIASSAEAMRYFRQEVRLARRITHPNACRTFDIEREVVPARDGSGAAHEIVFLTMELLEGETLDARIKREGSLPLDEAFSIAKQIADALGAAHRLGIIHRDLKPANIMLVPTGLPHPHPIRAVVTDFGLAHFEPPSSAPDTPLSEADVRPSGTLAYMAPEQLEQAPATAKTDIYAFGLILYEMVVGKRLFPADHFLSTISERLRGSRAVAETDISALPERWRQAVDACTRANVEERAASAESVVELLKAPDESAGSTTNGIEKHSVDPAPPSVGRTARRRMVFALAAIVVLCIAGIYAYSVKKSASERARLSAETSPSFKIIPLASEPGEADLPAFSPDGNSVAYIWDGGNQPHSDVYVLKIGSGPPLQITHTTAGVLGHPAWSNDGSQIAFSRCDGKNEGIYVAPSNGGPERLLTTAACMQAEPGRVAWLNGDQQILMVDRCSASGSFSVIRLAIASGQRECLTDSGPLKGQDAGFDFEVSPDGTTVAFTPAPPAIRCEIYTVSLHGGVPRKLTNDAQCWGEIMWSPDGNDILFSSTRTTLFTLNKVSKDGGPIEEAIRYRQIGSFSRDGRRLVYAERTGGDGPDVWRADLDSPGGAVQKNRKLIRIQTEEKDAQPSPDGTRIVWMSWRTGNAEIWTSKSNGDEPVQLTHLATYAGTPRWSPDGERIAFDGLTPSGTQIFIIGADGKNMHTLTSAGADNVVPSWSRDGKSVYFASRRSGSLQIWKHALDGGKETQVTTNGGFDCFESANGRKLFFSKFDKSGIWSIPTSGGPESVVLANLPQFGFWGQWAVTRTGLYVLDNDGAARPRVEFFDFATRAITPVFQYSEKPKRLQPGLGATLDGKTVYYTQFSDDDAIDMMQYTR